MTEPKYHLLTDHANIPPHELLKLMVLEHLHGAIRDNTSKLSRTVSDNLKKPSTKIFKSIDVDENDELIIAILGSLNIKKDANKKTWDELFKRSKNLYQLLIHLSHNGHHNIDWLLRLIKNTRPKFVWTWVWGSGTVLAGISLIGGLVDARVNKNHTIVSKIGNFIGKTIPPFAHWLGRTLSSAKNIPVLGMIITSIDLVWSWYKAFANGTTSAILKLKKLFYPTLSSGLNIAGYALSYLAKGSLSGPAAFLFIGAAAIELIRAVRVWLRDKKAFENMQNPDKNASWEAHAEYELARNLSKISSKSVFVKLGAALATCIVIGLWCFCPPSLFLTVSCIVFLTLCSMTKQSWLNRVRGKLEIEYQETLRKLPMQKSDEIAPQENTLTTSHDKMMGDSALGPFNKQKVDSISPLTIVPDSPPSSMSSEKHQRRQSCIF